jgi:hypothetical protein
MCGRLRIGKDFLHACSIGRCSHVFGLLSAVHVTAGHNAIRGIVGTLNSAHIHLALNVPVEEPSTASIGDMRPQVGHDIPAKFPANSSLSQRIAVFD